MAKKIAIVMGTRPEIIKLAELIRILKANKGIETELVFTGQHYSYGLFNVFMQELELPKLDINLKVGSGSKAEQVGNMLIGLEKFFQGSKPDIVVAEGDTNSVLAAALASFNCGIPFAHVEAGLRSFDRSMPEEINRILADQISDYCFAPTKTAVRNLENAEAIPESIFLTGNPIVEAVHCNLLKTKQSKILKKLKLEPESYAVLTAHRQENVDSKEKLEQLVAALQQIPIEIVFPIHPRSEKKLREFELWEKINSIKNVRLVEPVGYLDFLQLCSNSKFLLSDSGGVQEEASIYKKFVIVLRENTERPEILGKNAVLTGFNKEKIVAEAKKLLQNYNEIAKKLQALECPFGDGSASKRIAEIMLRDLL